VSVVPWSWRPWRDHDRLRSHGFHHHGFGSHLTPAVDLWLVANESHLGGQHGRHSTRRGSQNRRKTRRESNETSSGLHLLDMNEPAHKRSAFTLSSESCVLSSGAATLGTRSHNENTPLKYQSAFRSVTHAGTFKRLVLRSSDKVTYAYIVVSRAIHRRTQTTGS
jgi:hypothetical protein